MARRSSSEAYPEALDPVLAQNPGRNLYARDATGMLFVAAVWTSADLCLSLKVLFSGLFAAAICATLSFTGLHVALRSPILFTAFGFIVSIAVSFRMQASYNRWWEGRGEWDRLSAVSRNMARTVWLHVPPPRPDPTLSVEFANKKALDDKRALMRCIHALAVALKHHLRGEREWEDPDLEEFKELVDAIGDVSIAPVTSSSPYSPANEWRIQYPYDATNHPLTMSLYLSAYVEHVRLTTPLDTQVLTHLLLFVDTFTGIISACERLLRTPIPLGYNICICRLVWVFILCVPSQLWRELHWWTVPFTIMMAYMIFALAEVGLEIENPWGEGPNDLDLDRYCNLLALDLDEILNTVPPKRGWSTVEMRSPRDGSISGGSRAGSLRGKSISHEQLFGVLVDVGEEPGEGSEGRAAQGSVGRAAQAG